MTPPRVAVSLLWEEEGCRSWIRQVLEDVNSAPNPHRDPRGCFDETTVGRVGLVLVAAHTVRGALDLLSAEGRGQDGIPAVLALRFAGWLEFQPIIEAGFGGILLEPFESEEFRLVAAEALRGGFAINRTGWGALRNRRFAAREALIRSRGLNEREVAVLNHLAQHLRHKEIADKMGLSSPTTEKLVRKLYSKLGVRGSSECIVLWRGLG